MQQNQILKKQIQWKKRMHELPIVLEVIRLVNEEADQKGIKEIKNITIVVGELCAVMSESVQLYFELLSEGTPCDGAKLVFEHKPSLLHCTSCGYKFEHAKGFDCPQCGEMAFLVKGSGRELYVKAIDAS
jgi:hydrogenase nickel incorporation protein HypA/HybF